ncbi:putative 14-3-3 protein like protein [Fusarium oxysporum f. sp. albedinis]|nr:putative 14-3-3 protein like protein [Fusarium oxysporum f. sp. albedinis]
MITSPVLFRGGPLFHGTSTLQVGPRGLRLLGHYGHSDGHGLKLRSPLRRYWRCCHIILSKNIKIKLYGCRSCADLWHETSN